MNGLSPELYVIGFVEIEALWRVRHVVLYPAQHCTRNPIHVGKSHEFLSLPLVAFANVSVVTALQALLGRVVLSVCLEDLPGVILVGDTGEAVCICSLRTCDVERRVDIRIILPRLGLSPDSVSGPRWERNM